jgi:hypothetical protein
MGGIFHKLLNLGIGYKSRIKSEKTRRHEKVETGRRNLNILRVFTYYIL